MTSKTPRLSLDNGIRDIVRTIPAPLPGASGSEKKNYTEKLSHRFSELVAAEFVALGLKDVKAPTRGRDKQIMGGYGTKGVDVYLADDKHGLLLSSGTKGILFDVRKNLKNRYRDMVMEALELHKRFPFAVCGHIFFVGKSDSARASQKFGTVLGEAVALLETITERQRPDDAPELYERMGIVLIDPGKPNSVDLAPAGVPKHLQLASYCEEMVRSFNGRNPFY